MKFRYLLNIFQIQHNVGHITLNMFNNNNKGIGSGLIQDTRPEFVCCDQGKLGETLVSVAGSGNRNRVLHIARRTLYSLLFFVSKVKTKEINSKYSFYNLLYISIIRSPDGLMVAIHL